MNVAITGACGLLGAHLAAAFSSEHRVVGFDRHPWWGRRAITLHEGDLADDDARARFVEDAQPDVLIHCAAMVNVDACEERPGEAYRVNGAVTGLLARAVPRSCTFIYITTDGIFRGDEPMQTEADVPCPRTVYGRSKLHGEWETALHAARHLIIRTNFYGWSSGVKASSAEWLYTALEEQRPVTLFNDFWFTPIYVVDLVARIASLLHGEHTGTFHVTGGERVSKLDFGMKLAQAAGLSTAAVAAGSIDSAQLRADRPRDMSLDSGRAARATGLPAPDCATGVAAFVADRERELEERMAGLTVPVRAAD